MKSRSYLLAASALGALAGFVLLWLILPNPLAVQATETNSNPTSTSITITDNGFDPATITIETGATVVWTNQTTETVRLKSGYRYQIYLPTLLNGSSNTQLLKSMKSTVSNPLALLPDTWADDDIAPGNSYTYTFTAAGNYPYFLDNHSDSAGIVIVQDPTPDFTLSVIPNTQTVIPEQAASYTVTLTAINGFAESISLTVSNLPSGATPTWGDNPLVPTAETTLSIATTADTPTGTHTLTISAVADSQTHVAQVELTITSDTEGDDIPCIVVVGQPLPPAFPPVYAGCVTGSSSSLDWRFDSQGGVSGFDLTVEDNATTIYEASIDLQKASNGRIESYSGTVSGEGFPSFMQTVTNTYNPQGGLIGANIQKVYDGTNNEYTMELTQYCPLASMQMTGYRVLYNNEEITVGIC